MKISRTKKLLFPILFILIATNLQGQNDTLEKILLKNIQAEVVNKKIMTNQSLKELGYISLTEKKYSLNFVPIRQLYPIVINNLNYYQFKIDSLGNILKTVKNKEIKAEIKFKIVELKQILQSSSKYSILGFSSDSSTRLYRLDSYKDLNVENSRITDPVVPVYQVRKGSVIDTLVVFSIKNIYYGFYYSDLDPDIIELKRASQERKDREQLLLRLYSNNPLFTKTKDWTLEVFPDTVVYLRKDYYRLISLNKKEVSIENYKVFYSLITSYDLEKTNRNLPKVFLERYNNNMQCEEVIEFSHSINEKVPLMNLWKDHLDNRKSYSGTVVDTLYRISYPKNLVFDTIFPGEFAKRTFDAIKYDRFKRQIERAIEVDTVLVEVRVNPVMSKDPFSIEKSSGDFNPSGYFNFYIDAGSAVLSQDVVFDAFTETSISINRKVYDSRLGKQSYSIDIENIRYQDREEFWSALSPKAEVSVDFIENWFDICFKNVQGYYKDKLVEQEKEKEAMKQLYSKYGEKYVKAAENFEIIVGMPEELLPYPLKLWTITRRSRTSNGFTISCTSKIDTSKTMVVAINNGKVSKVSY